MNAAKTKTLTADLDPTEQDFLHRTQHLEADRAKHQARQRALDAELVEHLATRLREPGVELVQARHDALDLVRALGMSEYKARTRVSAALVAKDFPEVVGQIREGRLSFAAIQAIEPFRFLPGLVEGAAGKTRSQLESEISAVVLTAVQNAGLRATTTCNCQLGNESVAANNNVRAKQSESAPSPHQNERVDGRPTPVQRSVVRKAPLVLAWLVVRWIASALNQRSDPPKSDGVRSTATPCAVHK